ncbi:MAG: helix-turn-helix transcriptional regulator [Oscillospiraceae bacterium]|nr:helix-turn-helix transcriptional regulator [Oscillospiraceae bacterium]MBR6836871.1 helix-turn-helix transcriptional regulator [Oscillospiraceae bacterium]
MDTIKIGNFLKQLRKENGFTQEQLGEKIGVTNKTISRWETGTYLPPVECLAMLSDIYKISINELVAAQRLQKDEFENAADDNLSNALKLSESSFKKKEKRLTIIMILSTIIAIVLILLIPVKIIGLIRGLLIIALVIALAFISNTLNIVALLQNKEIKKTVEK